MTVTSFGRRRRERTGSAHLPLGPPRPVAASPPSDHRGDRGQGREARVADGQHRHGHRDRKDGLGCPGGPGRVRAQLAAGAVRRWGEDRASAEGPVWQAPEAHPEPDPQVLLAHDDASTTVPEACRVLGISKSSYYAALREGRRQALETAEAA